MSEDELIRIETEAAPRAIGPYSQAIVYRGLIYTAGQIALDPATGTMLDGDVRKQTERALENLSAVLNAAGTDLSRVVKATVFLHDMDDFSAMNEVYGRYFGDHRPARSAVQVARLPLDALVEIEVVAAAAAKS